MENRRRTFLDIEKNVTATKFQTKLLGFRTVGAPRSISGIAKLDTIQEEFVLQIVDSFYEKC